VSYYYLIRYDVILIVVLVYWCTFSWRFLLFLLLLIDNLLIGLKIVNCIVYALEGVYFVVEDILMIS